MTHTPLGPGREFDHIRTLLGTWGPVAHGIGDDAATLTPPPGQQLVISTDVTVEGVHFRREWLSTHDAGARGATAALSDLAAMAASAEGVLLSLVVPEIWQDRLAEFAAGVAGPVAAAGARIIGGNIARGETFSATFTVLGFAAAPVRRSGASPGDVLYVTGTLGGPKAALAAWARGEQPDPRALDRFLHPKARLTEARWLAASGATALIDISDGLAADARHLAAASGLSARISAGSVPRFDSASVEDALTSGEEYELLVAMGEEHSAHFAAAFKSRFELPLTRVGYLVPANAPDDRALNSLSHVELPGGHDHFSR